MVVLGRCLSSRIVLAVFSCLRVGRQQTRNEMNSERRQLGRRVSRRQDTRVSVTEWVETAGGTSERSHTTV